MSYTLEKYCNVFQYLMSIKILLNTKYFKHTIEICTKRTSYSQLIFLSSLRLNFRIKWQRWRKIFKWSWESTTWYFGINTDVIDGANEDDRRSFDDVDSLVCLLVVLAIRSDKWFLAPILNDIHLSDHPWTLKPCSNLLIIYGWL